MNKLKRITILAESFVYQDAIGGLYRNNERLHTVTISFNAPLLRNPLKGKIEWIKALHSGKYKKTTGSLVNFAFGQPFNEGGFYVKECDIDTRKCRFCCLGVKEMLDSGRVIATRSGLTLSSPSHKYLAADGKLNKGVRFLGTYHNNLASINDKTENFSAVARLIDYFFYDLDHETATNPLIYNEKDIKALQ